MIVTLDIIILYYSMMQEEKNLAEPYNHRAVEQNGILCPRSSYDREMGDSRHNSNHK